MSSSRHAIFAAIALFVAPVTAHAVSLILVRNQPIITLNFASGVYTGCPGGVVGGCLAVARTGTTATNLLPTSPSGQSFTTYAANTPRFTTGTDPGGILIEESRVNKFLNSTAPATQDITYANVANTLWVNGTGSIALTNGTATGCAGTASQGSPVTFTPTAGTCHLTLTGSLNAAQSEAGSFGTSLIVTAGASITRPLDVVTAIGPLQYLLRSGGTGTVLMAMNQYSAFTPANQTTFLAASGTTSIFLQVGSSTLVQGTLGSGFSGSTTLGNSKTWTGYAVKAAVGWDAAGFSMVGTGGTVVNQAHAPSYTSPFYIGTRNGSSLSANWPIASMTFWAVRLPDAQLQKATYP